MRIGTKIDLIRLCVQTFRRDVKILHEAVIWRIIDYVHVYKKTSFSKEGRGLPRKDTKPIGDNGPFGTVIKKTVIK